jgi:diguanylate cyclase (GGDEF)-like protein
LESWWERLFGGWVAQFQTTSVYLGWGWDSLAWATGGLMLAVMGRMVGAYGGRLPDFVPRPAAIYALGLFLGAAGAAGILVPLLRLPGIPILLFIALLLAATAGLVSLGLLGRGLTTLDLLPAVRGLNAEKQALERQTGDCGVRLERAERAERELGRRCEELGWEVSRLQEALADKDRALKNERVHDELTGLYNRAHFVERLREEFERGQRSGWLPRALFVGMHGMDDLPEREREWVLARAGGIIKQSLRLEDLASHYAEREFLLIATDATPEGVAALAKRLHKALNRGLRRGSQQQVLPVRCAYVQVELEVEPTEFTDYLEVLNRVLLGVRRQPADRLVRLTG